MRITLSKASLLHRWAWSTGLALAAFAVLAVLDQRLKALTGFGTADLQDYSQAWQFHAAFWAWAPEPFAARAGFNFGLDYLFMPLYAASFFYSALIAREGFAPRPGRLRRILALLALVPVVGALLDAAENALELHMMLAGPDDATARIAFTVSNAKLAAVIVGLALLAGAVLALVRERRKLRAA